MILDEIITRMAMCIHGLGLLSKVGGRLFEATAVSAGSAEPITAAMLAPFSSAKIEGLFPDGSETGVCFFRASQPRVRQESLGLSRWEADIVFTAWVNGEKVHANGSLESLFIAAVNSGGTINKGTGAVRSAVCEFTGAEDVPIDRFGWAKRDFRFNEHPNSLFGLRFRVVLFVASGCTSTTFNITNASC